MTYDRALAYAVENMIKSAKTHQVTLPKGYLTATRAHLDLFRRADERGVAGPTLAEAVLDAYQSGRDPLEDDAVRRAALADAVRTVPASVINEHILAQVHTVTNENLEAIIAAWQPCYDTAATELTAAHQVVTGAGIVDLSTPDVLLNAGVRVTSAYAAAVSALDTLRRIKNMITTLYAALDRNWMIPVTGVIRYADPGVATSDQLRRAGTDHWDLLTAGLRLSLATPAQEADRALIVTSNDEAAQQHVEQTRRRYVATHLGTGRSITV